MIGQRLKLARSAAGLSLRDLQAKIGDRVTAQAIGKYERDEDVPSSSVLIALSDALGVSLDYLAGDQSMVLEGVEFRKKQITSKKQQAQVEAQALHLIERYLMVEEILTLPSAEWDKPRGSPYPVRELGDVDRAAASLREHWNLGIDPIPNLIELLEERGIKVLVLDSAENIDGLAAQVRRSRGEPVRVIVIRKGVHGERQRFSLAHELGHMVMDIEGDEKFAEKAAHRFAGALLMPAEALLFREFSRLGYRTAPNYEPEHLLEEKPGRFDRLCYRALAEGAISEPKGAELLNITLRELNRRMEEPIAGTVE
jgi:transcriptional regulator with XRE-family HTH domain